MKKFLQIFGLLFSLIVFAQNISDYKHIYIPQEFADSKINQYGLGGLLASKLKTKKFVINESSEVNPCEILHAEISDISNMFTNKVKVDFKNCKNITVASFVGKSLIKEFEPGMIDALEKAAKGIAASNPVEKKLEENLKPTESVAVKETPKSVESDEKILITEKSAPKTELKTNTTIQNKAEIYTNGLLNLTKINISANQFILANPNNSVPYAIFNASAKKDVFRVQLENGTPTLGYWEDGKIVVEIPNSDGSFKREVFSKK